MSPVPDFEDQTLDQVVNATTGSVPIQSPYRIAPKNCWALRLEILKLWFQKKRLGDAFEDIIVVDFVQVATTNELSDQDKIDARHALESRLANHGLNAERVRIVGSVYVDSGASPQRIITVWARVV